MFLLQGIGGSRISHRWPSFRPLLHPYYGYTPASESDFIAMTYTLSDFLVYTCFTTTGEPNAALSNLSARPGDLLTILSTIHPAFLSVSPGDRLFILLLTTAKAALRPFPVAWLYHVTEEDCPSSPFFVTLGAALGPGTEKYVSGIFQQAWTLGPHARAYLNSSQLPLPYFHRTDELQAHTTLVHMAQNSEDMAPSSTISFSLPTRTIRSPLPILLSHPMRSRTTFSATF